MALIPCEEKNNCLIFFDYTKDGTYIFIFKCYKWIRKLILNKFNGKNYSAWPFQFQIFVKGKKLWSHFDWTDPALNKKKMKENYVTWEVKDA